ncbi:MAG: D-alanyl-D-alanine carboxypeptidase family protein [Bacillota bacterium]|jgi:D-alanyl-D-alanine carboxypeptidase (penicillin-binding protein 5/6)|nr:D-alanyl-D-alanine carboxypeptidase family protein [Bacillota bacterium]
MDKKKIILLFLLFLLLSPSVAGALEPPSVTARAAIVLDQATGRILFSKNAYEQLPMASTTKIMTAILAIESGRLDETVTVSEYASLAEGSSIDLEAGEKKTLEELLYGLILQSGNDAAVAIAEHLSGSVEEFAKAMTARSRELGANGTSFANPHGLNNENHYATAYDLALIASHAMSLPKFREVASTREKKISWTGRPYDRILHNQNRLLTMYEGAEGIKTGWTTPAGRCFVGAASREGWRLISVVLNAPQMWEDTITLLDFGFNNYAWETVVFAGQKLKTTAVRRGIAEKVNLVAQENIGLPLRENEAQLLRFEFNVPNEITAPVKKGQKIGILNIYFGRHHVAETPLLAAEEVKRRSFFSSIAAFFKGLFSR